MKQLKLMLTVLTAIFAAFGRLFAFRPAHKGGNFNFWRAFGAVCLSAILAIGNVAFAGNAAFAIGERQATDGRIDIAYTYRNSYAGVSKKEINTKRGGDGWTYLHEETARFHTEHMDELIRRGADIEIKTTTRGWTALHIAADEGHYISVRNLLRARANTEARDKEGKTPLHVAAQAGSSSAVHTLIAKRANVKAKDNKGRTPLHLAAQARHSKQNRSIMEDLLGKGADFNAKDNEGKTPLHLAAQANKIAAVRFLINKGKANKEAKDNKGRKPLRVAIEAGSTDVARRLVNEFKVNTSFIRKKGKHRMMALHHAAQSNEKAVKTLLALGAKVNVRDARGYTPLHHAALNNNAEAARDLLNKKAKLHAKAYVHHKATPLHLAARFNKTDVAAVLLEWGAIPILYDSDKKTPENLAVYHHGFFSGIAYLMREASRKMRCQGRWFCL